jgi:IclR family transcriptional regulator, KDG regulon repressor
MISSSEIQGRSAGLRGNGTIRSVDKVVDILEVLSRESRGLALGELAKRLDLNASTAHHLLATLKARGIVAQDERTKTYRIGYRLVSLVSRFLSGTDLYPAAIGPVEELRDRSGETSYISAFQGSEVAVIIALTGARPVQARRFHRPGQSNLHSTATGKVLLANLPPEDAEAALAGRELAKFTPNTITDRQRLHAELELIRSRGYAIDREEDYVGVECVAVPIFDASEECVAAVSVSYPAASGERTEELIRLVIDSAAKISANLGAGPVRVAM